MRGRIAVPWQQEICWRDFFSLPHLTSIEGTKAKGRKQKEKKEKAAIPAAVSNAREAHAKEVVEKKGKNEKPKALSLRVRKDLGPRVEDRPPLLCLLQLLDRQIQYDMKRSKRREVTWNEMKWHQP